MSEKVYPLTDYQTKVIDTLEQKVGELEKELRIAQEQYQLTLTLIFDALGIQNAEKASFQIDKANHNLVVKYPENDTPQS